MKTVTIEFDLYEKEHETTRSNGFIEGVAAARRIFVELLAGASFESLCESNYGPTLDATNVLNKLTEDMPIRIRMATRDKRKK